MEYEAHIAALETECAVIQEILTSTSPDAGVPTCPGWTLHDLASHAGGVMAFWSHVVCEGSGADKTKLGDPPEGAAIAAWFAQVTSVLTRALRATPPDTPMYSWVPDQGYAWFAARRMANELAVHRVDAQSALGAVEPIDVELAADGIDEIFAMLDHMGRGVPGQGESLHLHATDVEGEWFVVLAPDGVTMRHEHAKGDLAIRASVSDLEFVLYGRPALGEVTMFGDETVLDAWRSAFIF